MNLVSKHGSATILNKRIVLVRMKDGTNVDGEIAREGNHAIARAMGGDYGMLIDRTQDYSIMPVEVFNILNNIPTLKAIAVVIHRPRSEINTLLDQRLSQVPLDIFSTIEEAQQWLETTLDQVSQGAVSEGKATF